MQRGQRGLTAVELVEDQGEDPAGGPRPEPVYWRELVRRVPVWAWWVVACLSVAVAAATLVVQERADAAHERRVAQIGLLGPDLGAPLVQAWQVDVGMVVGYDGDLLFASDPRGRGLMAVDTGDGSVRWRRDDLGATGCEVAGEPIDSLANATDPHPTDAEDRARLMCFRWDSGPRGTSGDEVLVLDPASGELVRTLPIEVEVNSVTRSGMDVFVVGIDDEGYVVVDRRSLITGEQVWSYRSPVPPVEDQTTGPGASYDFSPESVQVQVGSWAVTLDAVTGHELPSRSEPEEGVTVTRFSLEDGAVVSVTATGGTAMTQVREADGATRWARDGRAVRPSVDDATAAGMVLMTDRESTFAVDARTGEALWSVDDAIGRAIGGDPLVLSSLVIAPVGTGRSENADAGLIALDADTGRVVWRTSDDTTSTWQTYTDGHRLLTLDRTGDDQQLVARDARTGTIAWHVLAPPTAEFIDLLPDRTILIGGSRNLTAFRSPRM